MSNQNKTREPWVPRHERCHPVQKAYDVAFVHGYVAPGWESLAQVFADNFSKGEIGASFCVVAGGQRVVDLWGGHIVAGGEPWDEDGMAVFYSCSKILTAMVIHRLVADGQITYDAPLSKVWPELKAGRAGGTLRMALAHTLGLPVLQQRLRSRAYEDHDYMVGRLEQQVPLWEPGTRVGYHPITFGFILGELVRRVTGHTLGRYFNEQFAQPLGLDLYVGLPESLFPRLAPIHPYQPRREDPIRRIARDSQTIGSIPNLWLYNSGGWRTESVNEFAGVKTEMPASNGAGNARALASLLAVFLDDRKRLQLGFNDETTATLETVSSATHVDATLGCSSRFSLGLMKSMDNRHDPGADGFIIGRRAFGHVGMGGSFGFCDREAGIAVAYVMNQLGNSILVNERGQALIDASYRAAGFERIGAGEWLPPMR